LQLFDRVYRSPPLTAVAKLRCITSLAGWELIHTVMALACPGGLVTAAGWDKYAGAILDACRARPDCDGVLLALHGAM
jgi:microcystin degradation protein MlrC